MAKKKNKLKGARSGYPTGGGMPGMTPAMQEAITGPGPFSKSGPPGSM